jgi:hypothetical protein
MDWKSNFRETVDNPDSPQAKAALAYLNDPKVKVNLGLRPDEKVSESAAPGLVENFLDSRIDRIMQSTGVSELARQRDLVRSAMFNYLGTKDRATAVNLMFYRLPRAKAVPPAVFEPKTTPGMQKFEQQLHSLDNEFDSRAGIKPRQPK